MDTGVFGMGLGPFRQTEVRVRGTEGTWSALLPARKKDMTSGVTLWGG